MFGRHYMRRARRRFEAGSTITQFSDLKSGDYIVHEMHGIGKYLGLRRFEGKPGDFLVLQYAAGDVLYVPVTGIDSIQKYAGGDGALPKVDRLGGSTWQKKKARVKKAVKDMTVELVKLYAQRESQQGHAFNLDTPWQAEFEDAFEYDETPDQLRAIQDMKVDMESTRPMDRLVCGDVGYGKTEVALRGAFKAVGWQAGRGARADDRAGAAAFQHLLRAHGRLPRAPRTDEPFQDRQADPREHQQHPRRPRRSDRRHTPRHLQGHRLQGSRAGDRGRRAALRRGAQGTPQATARLGGCVDAHGHAHPAHAALLADRHPRHERHQHRAQ
jgi:hypothetical protein